jgi:hypothetical protein
VRKWIERKKEKERNRKEEKWNRKEIKEKIKDDSDEDAHDISISE